LANAAALCAALLKPYRRCCGVGIWAECYPVALWLAHQRFCARRRSDGRGRRRGASTTARLLGVT
jgi:hypothetical protein